MTLSQQDRRAEAGLALLAVLWAVLILGLLASQVLNSGRGDLRLAASIAAQAKAAALAEGAVNAALSALAGGRSRARMIRTDGSIYSWQYGGGKVFVRITPETARIDLNNASPDLLSRLITAVGASSATSRAVAEAIAAFRGPGFEQPEFSSRDGGQEPKGAPFQSVYELMGVAGVTGDLFARIAPAVTVHSGQSVPAAQSALPIVKAALSGDVSTAGTSQLDVTDTTVDVSDRPQLIDPADGGPTGNATVYRIEAASIAPDGGRSSSETVVLLAPGSILPYRLLSRRDSGWLLRATEQETDNAK